MLRRRESENETASHLLNVETDAGHKHPRNILIMRLIIKKSERRSLVWSLVLTIYITLCYYALVGGNEAKRIFGYRKLISQPVLLSNGVIKQIVVGSDTGMSVPVILSGSSIFSPNRPNMFFLIIPGFFVFGLVFIYIHFLRNAPFRGGLLLFTFMAVCSASNAFQKKLLMIGVGPDTSVFMVSGFYGALFWFLDTYTADDFKGILSGIKGETQKAEILYDYTKYCLRVIIGLFTGICITFAWQVTTGFEKRYGEIGLDGIFSLYTAWLVLWGSIGLLGIGALETAGRMWAVMKSLKSNNEVIEK